MHELEASLRQLSETSGSLAEVTGSLDPRALPPEVQATARAAVEEMCVRLHREADVLASCLDPQAP